MIATQGRPGVLWYVTSYYLKLKISYSLSYNEVQENGSRKIFNGNYDSDTSVENYLPSPQIAMYVRLYPFTFNAVRAMRWEVYGCTLF